MVQIPTIEDRLVDHIQHYYGNPIGKKIDRDTDFSELQLDSLDLTELVIHVEGEFSVEIPDDQWDTCHTVAQMISIIKERLP